MIRAYKILEATTAGSLQAQVLAHLAQGWTLAGGVTASGKKLYQAVLK